MNQNQNSEVSLETTLPSPTAVMDRKEFAIFYDGLCYVCNLEIEHYKKQKGQEAIAFVDISHPQFSATAWNLDALEIQIKMHGRLANGETTVGIQTFIEIWKRLPKYSRYVNIAQSTLGKKGLEIFYRVFVKIRPYLPRRKPESAYGEMCMRESCKTSKV